METIKQEKRELREDMNSLKIGMERMTTLLESFVATQKQPPPPPHPQVIFISDITTDHVIHVVLTALPRKNQIPAGYPWGMRPNYLP